MEAIIMLPRLYDASLSKNSYKTNGYGFIRDCTECLVTEELNGAYSLTLKVASTDPLIDNIGISMIIKAKANNEDSPQLFEINKIVATPQGGLEIQAQHIKFLCCQNCISNTGNTVDYKETGTPQAIMDTVFSDLMFENHFEFYSDIETSKEFDLSDSPSKKLGDIFGGTENSLITEFGGEFHYDNFKIEFLKSRGSDSGHKIMFGHNMSDYNQTVTNDAAYSHLMGYAKVTRSDISGGSATLAGSPVLSNTDRVFPKVKLIDFSSKVREYFGGDFKVNPQTGENYQDAIDMITYFTNEYMILNVNYRTVEEVNITITYDHELDKLQNIKLGDTVKVCFGKGRYSLSAKISKAIYDSLAERYISIEVGEHKTSLLNFIQNKRR